MWRNRSFMEGEASCMSFSKDIQLKIFGIWMKLDEHGFGKKRSQCKGGKKAKQRFTIALIANAAGGKESAIVIWKAEKPRCFKV